MPILQFTVNAVLPDLGQGAPAPVPIGSPIPTLRSKAFESPANPKTRTGIWDCTTGRFRRQVVQAEFCHFIEGECTFTPDEGEPVEIRAGDILFFPPNTAGVWDIRTFSRKIFIVFDGAK
jgi:uncharacterized cupin superfamily protein